MMPKSRILRAAVLTIGVLFAGGVGAAAQSAVGPDPRPPQEAGSVAPGTINVTVVTDEGVPARRVVVTLGRPGVDPHAAAVTGPDGRCDFANVSPGNYLVVARQDERFTSIFEVERVRLDAGATVQVTLRYVRSGVIAGRVTDADGLPMPDARVDAIAWSGNQANRRESTVSRHTSTDDRGEYRLSGLNPGRYAIRVSSGLAGASRSWPLLRVGLVPTYHPGGETLNEAAWLTVRPGVETAGVNISPLAGPLATVRVSVTGAAAEVEAVGRAGRPQYSARLVRDGAVLRDVAQQVAQARDGTLRFDAVPPGRYTVEVLAPGPEGGPRWLKGLAPLTTNGEDVLVTVAVNRGATIAGRVLALPMPPGFEVDPVVAAVLAGSRAAGTTRALAVSGQGERLTAAVTRDGTFVLEGVRGHVRLGVEFAAGAWLSTHVGTHDVTGTGFSVTGEERIDAEVVITEGIGLITGRVTDAAGKPATGHTVVAFPDDERRIVTGSPWAVTAPTMRDWNTLPQPLTRAGWTRETLEGRFHLPPLPPGTFRIAAFPHDQSRRVAPLDPDVLRVLHPLATRVTLAPGQHVVVKLAAVPIPEVGGR